MKIRTRRLFAICLSVLLVICFVLTGCAGNNGNRAERDGAKDSSVQGKNDAAGGNVEKLTITVYSSLAGTSPTQDNKLYKKIKDKLGVTFKIEFLVGEAQQKAGVMIAGGDYPDLIGTQGQNAQQFIDAGAFIPLEDYIDKYPNLKKHYGSLKNRIKDEKSGHVYIMPNYGVHTGTVYQNESWGPAFWIQKAVLKEFGYPKIKTLDQFFDIIKKYKDKYPTIDGQPTIGFEILTDKSRDWPLRNAPAQLSGHPNDGGVIVDNNVAQIYADKDISKQYFKKINEMYNQGLVDPESFVMNYDQYIAKLSSGRVLGLYDQRWNFEKANTSLLGQKRDERTFAPCPVTFSEDIKDWYLTNPTLNINSGFAISTKCKDPDKVMKVLDTLLSEEWQKLLQWGVEGEDYMVGNDGKYYRTPEQRDQQNSNEWKLANRADALLEFLPKLEGTYSDNNATSAGVQPGEYYEGLRPIDKEMLSAYGVQTQGQLFSTPPKDPVYFPCYTIQIPHGSKEQVIEQRLKDYAFQYLPNIIKSKTDQFDKEWNKYIDQLKKVDIKTVEDLYNKGIQERIKNWTEK